ncbi:MAG: tRNA pseudouridine(55) synthase TruB [Bacteroidales bacterium]|nr:tRNA pseudouridine(55) synthase TruB [Bacteroidales bacterium]
MEKLSRNIEDYPEGIVLPIDKPYRWTSADVIRKVKYAAIRHFGKKNLKVGHAGTLDPLATGILLVCIGPATRRAEELQRSRKRYLAGVSFGATTPSYDLEKPIDREYPVDGVSEESVRAVLKNFLGEQDQVAPLFSAKSVDGVRVYETARKLFKQGLPVEDTGILQANRITIYDIKLVGFGPAPQQQIVDDGVGRIRVADISDRTLPTAMIDVECSKGTYIRALARDLGEALGSGAFLSSLRRIGNGGYTIEDALTLDEALQLLSE